MSRRVERFEISGTPRIFLRLPAGAARVVAGEEAVVEVRMSGREATLERFLVEERGGRIVIEPEGGRIGRWAGVDVELRLGTGADVHTRLTSGDVSVNTEIATLVVESASGDVAVGAVSGDVKIKTASGDIKVGSVGGRLDVAAASGDVRVGSSQDVVVKTASGDIDIGEVAGSMVAHSASGDIEVERFTGDLFQAKTLSGDVLLGLTAGRSFAVEFQSLSGDIRTRYPVDSGGPGTGTTARLAVTTMSGDIVVRDAG
jgi:DUF4097 and DUF4098 domain-containing protein YvlB